MMKTFYTVLLIIISVSLFAQNTEMIVPFYNNGKWGFMNKTFIGRCGNHPCLRARPSKSIEIIKQGNKYGIINNKLSNAIVVKKDTIIPMFDTIVPVTSQLMYVVKDSLFSFIHQGSFWSGADYVVQKLNFEYEDIKVFNCNLCSTGYNEV